MRYFLIKLQNRPDDVTNTSITHYSTFAVTMAMLYQECATAVTSTTYTSVYLAVVDQEGNVYEQRNIETQYTPPEPEPEPDDSTESTEEA